MTVFEAQPFDVGSLPWILLVALPVFGAAGFILYHIIATYLRRKRDDQ